MDETKSWYFEKINKIDKSLPRLKKKRERTQINKIRSEKVEMTTDTTEIRGQPEETRKKSQLNTLTWVNTPRFSLVGMPRMVLTV